MKNKEGKVKEILARKNSHTPKFPFLFFPENLRGKFLLQKPTNDLFLFFPFPPFSSIFQSGPLEIVFLFVFLLLFS